MLVVNILFLLPRKSHGTEQNHNLIVWIVPCNICFQRFDKLKRMIYNLFKFNLWFRTKRLSKSQLEQNHKTFVLSESSYMSFFFLQFWLCLTYDYIKYIVADMGQIIYFCHVILDQHCHIFSVSAQSSMFMP